MARKRKKTKKPKTPVKTAEPPVNGAGVATQETPREADLEGNDESSADEKEDAQETAPVNRLPKVHEGGKNKGKTKKNTRGKAKGPAKRPKSSAKPQHPDRVPAPLADFYAAKLHESQATVLDLKKRNLNQRLKINQLEGEIIKLTDTALAREINETGVANAVLRKDHNLELGGAIHRDDETGEAYRDKAKK